MAPFAARAGVQSASPSRCSFKPWRLGFQKAQPPAALCLCLASSGLWSRVCVSCTPLPPGDETGLGDAGEPRKLGLRRRLPAASDEWQWLDLGSREKGEGDDTTGRQRKPHHESSYSRIKDVSDLMSGKAAALGGSR